MSDNLETKQTQPERRSGDSPRALSAAAEIYARWEAERERSPLDRVVAAEFRTRRYLNSSERRGIADSIYNAVRYLRLLTWLLKEQSLPDTPENRLRLWREQSDLPHPRPLSETERGATSPPAPLRNGAIALSASIAEGGEESESNVSLSLQERIGVRSLETLRLLHSFPDAMADELEALLGAEAVEAGAAFNRQAPTILRVNPLRTTRTQMQESLPDARPTRYSPWGMELAKRGNIYDMPGFREGHFEVQEEASQLAALLTDARPGQTVVEVGAGAGGKTLALAALMQNRGRLIALDTSAVRLDELQKRAVRAGAKNARSHLLTANEAGVWQLSGDALRNIDSLRHAADCVLIDAPCSGSGVLRRSPDAKWRVMDTEALSRLQQTLLRQGSELVAAGGVLIYVTCAFERSQNEAVVAAFLDSPAGAEFTLESVLPRLQSACRRAAQFRREPPLLEATEKDNLEELVTGPYLRTWPHRHNLDSFFAACLRRTSKR